VAAAALAGAVAPVFRVFEFLRIGEYSLRNSASRCGLEIVYAALPDKLRVEVRPLVDVVGERLGDMSAAGMLHLLLSEHTGMNFTYTLFVVASLGTTLWICSEWLLRRVDHMKAAAERDNEIQLPLQKLAREGAVLA
jgi:ATP/ADP translocase